MKKNVTGQEPELSRPLKLDSVSLAGIEEKIVAKPLERKALAQRLGLLDLPRFEATVTVEHEKRDLFAVKGRVYAEVVQACVVTLEPVSAEVTESFDQLFVPAHLVQKKKGPLPADYSDRDPPEPIEGGIIDLGEFVVQQLALALPDYPRKQGAAWTEVEPQVVKAPDTPSSKNPFLKLIKDKK